MEIKHLHHLLDGGSIEIQMHDGFEFLIDYRLGTKTPGQLYMGKKFHDKYTNPVTDEYIFASEEIRDDVAQSLERYISNSKVGLAKLDKLLVFIAENLISE